MARFKVGDRVQRLQFNNGGMMDVGATGTVVKIGAGKDVVYVDVDGGIKSLYSDTQYLRLIEPAPKFAVGDRVRVVKLGAAPRGSHHSANIGDTATLKEFTYGKFWRTDTFDFYEHEIEPATTPLAIREGGVYKTRDGRKVGPMEDNGSGQYYWRSPDDHDKLSGYMAFWLDLIAEWVDEPVADAPAKFKVGDRVVHDGHTAILREILDDGRFLPYLIEFESDVGYGHNGNYIGKVRLTSNRGWWVENITAAPAPSAIVALIENGQPRPSANPFIHPDRDAATKEARRLAGKHKGQEFGVYELVSSERQDKVYEHEWQWLAAGGETYHARKELQRTGITGIQASRIVQEFVAAA